MAFERWRHLARGAVDKMWVNRGKQKPSAIAGAIDGGLIYQVYQPIVDIENGHIFAYEGLARTSSPHFNGPIALFEAALEAGLCGRLGRELRAMSIRDCPLWPLFVNVNPNEFNEGWLVRPDDPLFWHEQEVYVEITESVPLSHFEFCHSVLAEIRGKGVKLAVDDLGAGYSNLGYIAELEPDIVKLDRELIVGLQQTPRKHRLVTAIVKLCVEMGAKVVAEGIETIDEFHAVRDAGVHFGQGYLLARPGKPPPAVSRIAGLWGG